MTNDEKRTLKVFLCHASGDKPQVRNLYKRLSTEGVDAWLDQEKLLPGQDWRVEIPRAVQEADVVVVCLSNKSITKEGYIQKEIKFALDSADEKPDGTIFLIPARLEDCPVPEKLSRWQWVDLFEDNGYLKLLSSLKLRADKVGAVISPASYQEGDAETERRLDQYYTEGLAAFYTEDWDKACQRFQLILREKPNHKIAIEKLEEAERQRDLAKLYAQTTNAIQAQDWQAAIRSLEDLLKRTPDYKDSALLYRNAKKQKQLKELYAEAKKLHAAEKWQAVVKVFDQILSIEPTHPDSDGLLPSAQKEVAELKRLSDLNELYAQAVREMDMGKWYEARALLEQVHKAQTGFLETERLLRKTEDEILKIEESNARVNQVNTLYEQAHGLLRAKNWRQALDKMNEIQKLDSQFDDKDGIVEKVKAELEREEQEAQKQNQLAAMYADAVRLLKEGKYQESLEKWDEVKAFDPKYPDRQWVQKNARKRLAVTDKNSRNKLKSPIKTPLLVWAIFIFLVFLLRAVMYPTERLVYLADMEPLSSKVGNFELGIGKYPFSEVTAVAGNVLKAKDGSEFRHGLFAHAPSRLTYRLPKNTIAFSSSIYIDGYIVGDSVCTGNAVFIILIDDAEVYRSQYVTYGNSLKPIKVFITFEAGEKITLITDPVSDAGCDWTVWGDPYLTIK